MKKRDVATILLYNDKKEILFQHRDDDAERLPGYRAFFGGWIDEGETPEQAVIRETKEELDYDLINPSLLMSQEFEGIHHNWTKYVFMEEYDPSKKLTQHEGQDMKWMSLPISEDVKMSDHDREALNYVHGKF